MKALNNNNNNKSKNKAFDFDSQNRKIVDVVDAIEDLKANGIIKDIRSLVQFASYAFVKSKRAVLEEIQPDLSKFMALSWDPKASRLGTKVNKHYRYYVKEALESTPFIDENTFD
jgi:hypothetical protein